MPYVTIINGTASGISSHLSQAPDDHVFVEITNEEYSSIAARTHYYDVAAKAVLPNNKDIVNSRLTMEANAKHQSYLRSTDWMVLRHQRELTLGKPTTLTQAELVALETKRQAAADSIIQFTPTLVL